MQVQCYDLQNTYLCPKSIGVENEIVSLNITVLQTAPSTGQLTAHHSMCSQVFKTFPVDSRAEYIAKVKGIKRYIGQEEAEY